MARAVVTGGAGFIGSHLVERLLTDGFEVSVIDNFYSGRPENLIMFGDKITLHEIDIRDALAVSKAMEGADYVFHQAALPSVPRSVKFPLESHDVNATGTLNVLRAAHQSGVKRVIYAASSSAYGNTDESVKHENLPSKPISPYAVAKLTGENYCRAFSESYGLETVSLRYFNIFGPRQNPHSPYTGVMAIFIPLMLQDKQPTIYGDGNATRDFTNIRNVVHANMLAMTAPNAVGEVMNIACGQSFSIRHIVDTINELLGKEIKPILAPPRAGDVQHSLASIDQAKRLLGYEPVSHFKEGMAETIEWYRQEMSL